jgi:hypothetical protein
VVSEAIATDGSALRPQDANEKEATFMTTADSIREHAISLARSGVEPPEAIRELEASSGGRRVAVVRARQQLLSSPDEPDDQAKARAVALLDELLGRLPV